MGALSCVCQHVESAGPTVDIHAQHASPVIGQQRRQRSPYDLAPVDDRDDLSPRPITPFEELVVDAHKLEHLDDGQRGTGEDGFDRPWRSRVFGRVRIHGGRGQVRGRDGSKCRGRDVSDAADGSHTRDQRSEFATSQEITRRTCDKG